jgi:hypothetical protein
LPYLWDGGCSDDSFMDFRAWLVFSGREAYEAALADADGLVARVDEYPFIEEYNYVASQVFEERFGTDIPHPGLQHPREPIGEKWTEDDLPRLLPRFSAWAEQSG